MYASSKVEDGLSILINREFLSQMGCWILSDALSVSFDLIV